MIALSDTWLSPSTTDEVISFPTFQKPYRKERQDHYGGVIVYVKQNIPCKRRHDLEINAIECIWLELKLKSKTVLFSVIYRPPNSTPDVTNEIERSIDLAVDTNISTILITGDLNLNYLENQGRLKLNSLFSQYNLCKIVQEPTHFTETSYSLIDLFYTSHQQSVLLSGVGEPFLDQNIRYHCPIYAVFNFDKHKLKCFKRKIWIYDRGDYKFLKQKVTDVNWNALRDENVNVHSENVTDKILELCEQTIPSKEIIVRPADTPWMNGIVRKAIRKRKRAHKTAKRLNSNESWAKYRILRNKSVNAIKNAKIEFKENLANKINANNKSSRDWRKTFKSLLGKDKHDSIPPLNHNNTTINGPTEKADLLNNFFVSQTIVENSDNDAPNLTLPDYRLNEINVTADEVKIVLKSLVTGKALGPDLINNKILKKISDVLAEPLTDLFNASLSTSTVPDIWKRGNVTPIHKKNLNQR